MYKILTTFDISEDGHKLVHYEAGSECEITHPHTLSVATAAGWIKPADAAKDDE